MFKSSRDSYKRSCSSSSSSHSRIRPTGSGREVERGSFTFGGIPCQYKVIDASDRFKVSVWYDGSKVPVFSDFQSDLEYELSKRLGSRYDSVSIYCYH